MTLSIKKIGLNGPALVLFHGWGFDSQIWFTFANQLKTKFQLYLVDLPGFGQTSMMHFDSFQNLLLDSLPEKFSLVGWSMGGLYTTKLAFNHPSHIQYLINIASSPCFVEQKQWPGIKPMVLEKFAQSLKQNTDRTVNQFVQLQLGKHIKLNHHYASTRLGLENGLLMLESWDLRTQLDKLTLPVYYLFGRLDAIVPHAVFRVMRVRYPQFKLLLFRQSAHMPFITEQQACLDFFYSLLG